MGATNNVSLDQGRLFKVNLDGTGFTTLHIFTGTNDGATPHAGLVVAGDTIFGVASFGANDFHGSPNYAGTVFKLSTNGSNFTTLHSFTGGSDGAVPAGGLILAGNTLYGAAFQGATATPNYYGGGTIFAINTDGTRFTSLHIFSAVTVGDLGYVTNLDGANPIALKLAGNTLYGSAEFGGSLGSGTLFAVNTDGTDFRILHTFTGTDGVNPETDLLLSGDTLYGTTPYGGTSGNGTIFSVKTNGTGFTTLYNFTGTTADSPTNSDGANPDGHLILAANTLYGDAALGGLGGNGTIFSLALMQVSPPELKVVSVGPDVILTWPTTSPGFTLQSTTSLASSLWSTLSASPVVVNGQNTVSNPISGAQQFYRLSQ
jgi:uncharacterized repeat protein (TIGR03803 family)